MPEESGNDTSDLFRRVSEKFRSRGIIRDNVRYMTWEGVRAVEPELETVGGNAGFWSSDGKKFCPCYSMNVFVDKDGKMNAAGTELSEETKRKINSGELMGFHLIIPFEGVEGQVVRVTTFAGTHVGREMSQVVMSSVKGYNSQAAKRGRYKFIDPSKNEGVMKFDFELD